MAYSEDDYQEALDTIAAIEAIKEETKAWPSANGHHLTSLQIETLNSVIREAIGEAFHQIESEAREVRDVYERADTLKMRRELSIF